MHCDRSSITLMGPKGNIHLTHRSHGHSSRCSAGIHTRLRHSSPTVECNRESFVGNASAQGTISLPCRPVGAKLIDFTPGPRCPSMAHSAGNTFVVACRAYSSAFSTVDCALHTRLRGKDSGDGCDHHAVRSALGRQDPRARPSRFWAR